MNPVSLRHDLAQSTELLHTKLGAARAEEDILLALGISGRTLRRWRRQGPPESAAHRINWLLSFARVEQ